MCLDITPIFTRHRYVWPLRIRGLLQKGADGGPRRWGSKNHDFPTFCFGPKSGPKAPFGVKIGGTDTENHEESEKQTSKLLSFSKIYLFLQNC